MPVIPFMNKPEKALKSACLGMFLLYIIGLFTSIMPIGVLGVELTKLQLVPSITILEVAELPGAFIERLGSLYICFWIVIAFPSAASLLYIMSLTLSQMFKIKNHRPFLFPMALLIYFVSTIPKNATQYEKFFKFLTPYGIAELIVIPLMLYVIALIRKVKDD